MTVSLIFSLDESRAQSISSRDKKIKIKAKITLRKINLMAAIKV
jgi:hypothetical protein